MTRQRINEQKQKNPKKEQIQKFAVYTSVNIKNNGRIYLLNNIETYH